MNWISPTGFSPCAAMPTQSPLIRSSASGVSNTRSDPKRCCNPTVARKTPPFTPTSSPSTMTESSCAISHASARFTASTRLISAMVNPVPVGGAPRLVALLRERCGQRRVEVIEHVLGLRRGRRFVGGDLARDLVGAFALQRLFPPLVPHARARDVFAKPRDGLGAPRRAHLF